MQAAAASIIGIFGACVLQEAQPYRRGSDNEIEVLAQYCIFLWCFSVVFRDMGISDLNVLLTMGIVLIVATFAVFGFALWRASTELKLLRSEQQESSADDVPTVTETAEDSVSPTEAKGGGNSPQDTTIEVDVMSTAVNNQHDGGAAPSKTPKSPWQLLGLCSADSELGDHSADDAHSSRGEVAKLLAKLEEQSKACDEALRAKDQVIREKDAEIRRLAAATQ